MNQRRSYIVMSDLFQHQVGGVITATPLVWYPRVEGGGVEDVCWLRQSMVPSTIQSSPNLAEKAALPRSVISMRETVCQ